MPYIPPEIVKKAEEMDLLTYLQNYEPDELVKIENGTYTTKTHDSMRISNGLWNWFSEGIGGKNAVSYLMKVKKYSFLEGNCCEVGAGNYPRLAELTAPQIKLKKGTLTIYEPNILFTKIDNVTIIKDKFKKSTNINHIDTIYGMFPCEASITIAEKAFEEDKNLLLAFCSCDHSTKEHPKWLGTYWAEDFCMDYREKYGHEVEIIDWPTTIGIDFPIMVRQKIKK